MPKYFLVILVFLSGCAATGEVKNKATQIMGGSSCYELFVNNSMASYQHCTHQIAPTCVFALAVDNQNRQACSFARKWELFDNLCLVNCNPTWTQVEALALSRCEEARAKTGNVNAPCKVFSRNNEIVWDEYKNKNVEFQ